MKLDELLASVEEKVPQGKGCPATCTHLSLHCSSSLAGTREPRARDVVTSPASFCDPLILHDHPLLHACLPLALETLAQFEVVQRPRWAGGPISWCLSCNTGNLGPPRNRNTLSPLHGRCVLKVPQGEVAAVGTNCSRAKSGTLFCLPSLPCVGYASNSRC